MTTADVSPPAWLDNTFVEKTMRIGLKNQNIKIKNVEIEPAVAKGCNYFSQLFRIKTTILKDNNTENISLIAKLLPTGPQAKKSVTEMKFFQTEAKILANIIPSILKLLEPAGQIYLTPKCYYHEDYPRDLIIMEDMNVKGFKLLDRLQGLDINHAALVLENLACYHAGGFLLLQQRPELKEEFKDSFWDETNTDKNTKLFKGSIQALAEEVQTWNDFPKEYAERLFAVVEKTLPKTYDAYRVGNFKMNTLTHGDLWISNILFKHDSLGNPISQVFIDFQMSSYRSPVLDIQFFLFCSLQFEFRLNIEHLLNVYYKKLISVLDKCKAGITLTFDELLKEFDDRLFFGFISLFACFPIQISRPEDMIDMGEVIDSSTEFNHSHLFKSEYMIRIAKKMLPYFVEKGII